MNRTTPNYDARFPWGQRTDATTGEITTNAANARAREATQHAHIIQYGTGGVVPMRSARFRSIITYMPASALTFPTAI